MPTAGDFSEVEVEDVSSSIGLELSSCASVPSPASELQSDWEEDSAMQPADVQPSSADSCSEPPRAAVRYDFHGLARARSRRNSPFAQKQRAAKYGRCRVCQDTLLCFMQPVDPNLTYVLRYNSPLPNKCHCRQEVLKPIAHASRRHRGEVVLRCKRWWEVDAAGHRLCWLYQPYKGDLKALPKQVYEAVLYHRRHVDVALKRAAGCAP